MKNEIHNIEIADTFGLPSVNLKPIRSNAECLTEVSEPVYWQEKDGLKSSVIGVGLLLSIVIVSGFYYLFSA